MPAAKKRRAPKPFDAEACLAFAHDAMSRPPPADKFIERHEPAGEPVALFVLPLDTCWTENERAKSHQIKSVRKDVAKALARLWVLMSKQCPAVRRAPLAGRPQVLCTRFSHVQPDEGGSWSKWPVDRLQPLQPRLPPRPARPGKGRFRGRKARPGLNIIADDKPSCVDKRTWWEPATPGKGFVLIRVYTGDPNA